VLAARPGGVRVIRSFVANLQATLALLGLLGLLADGGRERRRSNRACGGTVESWSQWAGRGVTVFSGPLSPPPAARRSLQLDRCYRYEKSKHLPGVTTATPLLCPTQRRLAPRRSISGYATPHGPPARLLGQVQSTRLSSKKSSSAQRAPEPMCRSALVHVV
jgi:hypothetical protein